MKPAAFTYDRNSVKIKFEITVGINSLPSQKLCQEKLKHQLTDRLGGKEAWRTVGQDWQNVKKPQAL